MPAGSVTVTEKRKSIFGTNLRWSICGLLFFATTVNYVDRQVLGILKPVLEHDLHWNEQDYSWVVFTFQLAYALMMPLAGRAMDWLGTRVGYAIAVAVWSTASMLHALASTPFQFAMARFALGLGEASNFPAAIKTVADWFPKRERSLCDGYLQQRIEHRCDCCAPRGADRRGALRLARFVHLYRQPRRRVAHRLAQLLSQAQRAQTADRTGAQADRIRQRRRDAGQVPYSKVISKRPAWAFLAGKFLTDPVWWFYLFWIPGFLHDKYNLDLTHLGPPLIVIYVVADIGSVLGGWLSKGLVSRGADLSRARKTAMLPAPSRSRRSR